MSSILNDELLNICKSDYKCKVANINGFDYPCDALEFFKKYSEGINDYIWFLHPYMENWEDIAIEYRNTYDVLKTACENDKIAGGYELQDNEGFPFEFYPEKNGLVPWAQCDNGTVMYLKNDNSSVKVIVYGDSYEFYEYNLSMTEFLYKLINREIDCSRYLPSDLFEDDIICQ